MGLGTLSLGLLAVKTDPDKAQPLSQWGGLRNRPGMGIEGKKIYRETHSSPSDTSTKLKLSLA